ncbi:TPA: glycosyltransferase [Photobacterium damselae]
MKKRLIFWANIYSPHLSWFFQQLRDDFDIVIITSSDGLGERGSQGWDYPDDEGLTVLSKNSKEFSLLNFNEDCFHIYCGFHILSEMKKYYNPLDFGFDISVIAEAPIVNNVLEYFIKYTKYKFYSYIYKNKIRKIYAMGELGVHWYEKIFPKGIVKEFQYFISPSYNDLKFESSYAKNIRFVFVGQFIKRKNILMLLNALDRIDSKLWTLDLIGDGVLNDDIVCFVQKKKLEENVYFRGGLNNKLLISKFKNDYDFLVLPSLFDGWGAVVSEALINGVRVITNANCGSSILIKKNHDFGYIYDGSLSDLHTLLLNVITNHHSLDSVSRCEIIDSYKDIQKDIVMAFIQDFNEKM